MDKHTAQRILNKNGPGLPRATWLIMKTVLSGESGASVRSLAEHIANDAQSVVDTLRRSGLCSWALHACPSLREAPASVQDAIARAAQYEFGTCAQRKLAMIALDTRASELACHPVVIKGAANALTCYPKESLRPSRDIDVIVDGNDVARLVDAEALADGHDWGGTTCFDMAGYVVEAHRFLMAPGRWGSIHDLSTDSDLLPGFTALRHPDPVSAFTISLLHFAHHFGVYTFDLLDMACMVRSGKVDMERAIRLWKGEGLIDLILPGLTLLDLITPVVSADAWRALFNSLTPRRRFEVIVGLRFLSSGHFSKFRAEWFNSRFEPPSFFKRIALRFFGSTATTEQITGLRQKNPLFWFFHVVGLPMKRIAFSWK